MALWEVTIRAGDAVYRGICALNRMPNKADLIVYAMQSFHQTPGQIDVRPITMDEVRANMRRDPHYGLILNGGLPSQNSNMKLFIHEPDSLIGEAA